MRPALALALLALLWALAVFRSGPPAPKPESAPPAQFSAGRAEKLLAELVGDGAPHPAGTEAHDLVRDRIAADLAALELTVERPSRFVCGRATCAVVTDLLARIPGRVGANAVVLTAHYDSVPAGPGASDDGMGVATVLEVARALRASPALRRPVWLLLTDGEELGLLGAQVIVKNPLLRSQVAAVVNIEARGTSGPSLMFETSARNAGLVRTFAESTEHPIASSLFPTLYSMLPNDTDLSVYEEAGLAGLNYAIVGGAARYHTPRDDVAHADLGSLQHHGDNALAVLRALADGAQPLTADDDLVFFDVLGAFVVRWPGRASLPIALGLLLVLAFSAVTAVRKGLLTYRRHAVGLLAALGVPVAVPLGLVAGTIFRTPGAWVAHPWPMIVGSCALGALTALSAVVLTSRAAGPAGLFWGTATVLGIVGAVVSARLPGLSFLLLVPLAGACAGSLAFVYGAETSPSRLQACALALPAGAVLVWATPLGLVYDALGAYFLPFLAAGTAMVVWTSAPALAALAKPARRVVLAGLGLVFAGACVLTRVVTPFDADVPEHVSVRSYAAEGEPSRTLLFSAGDPPARLARLFPLRDAAWPWSRDEARGAAAAAPDVPVPLPTLEVVATTDAPTRRVDLRLRSSRGASIVGLAIEPGNDVGAVRMRGEELAPPAPMLHRAAPWSSYECVTTPDDGIDVELSLPAGRNLVVYVYDRKPGLPEGEPRTLRDARGPEAVPYGAGDYSVAARRVEL